MIGASFHTHLDVCRQCRENPCELCRIGLGLLKAAAEGIETAMTIAFARCVMFAHAQRRTEAHI